MPQAHRLALPSATARDQVRNKELWNASRERDCAHFYSLGYTGRKLADILDALVSAGVRSVLDIRQHAVSMYRPEVSKAKLGEALEACGIAYHHEPALGVPRDIRVRAIETGTRDTIWHWYDEHVVKPYLGRNMDRFLNALEHPVALMCVEIDPRECHRHRLALALEARGLRGFDL